jgi:hypothetical protein
MSETKALEALKNEVVALRTEVQLTNQQLIRVVNRHDHELFGQAGENGIKGRVSKLMDFMYTTRKRNFVLYAAVLTALTTASAALAVNVITT